MTGSSKSSNIPVKENRRLPSQGIPDGDLLATLEAWKDQDEERWKRGQASGAVYHGGEEHMATLNRAMGMFAVANPLHSDLWPSLTKMEAEIVAMTANLVGGGEEGNSNVCGMMTSGGTESIFIAIKAHRQRAEQERGITAPELVCSINAHAAVQKACDILKIKMIETPCTGPSFQADPDEMAKLTNRNTIMWYASAPSYAHGIIDPIETMASIAQRHQIGLHVDCCLGGFILPFARRLRPGTIPAFDFSVPGVTSMSCDTHKYGYAVKGTSVCLFNDKALRRHAYFASPDWTGGQYITATPAGSRPGGASAATWTSLMRMGDDGFMKATEEILTAAERLAAGVRGIEGLKVVGNPVAMMIAISSDELDIHFVGRMAKKRSGFGLSSCQYPPCIHLCTTLRHVPHIDEMLEALKFGVGEARREGKLAKQGAGDAEIYGVTDGSGASSANSNMKAADLLASYVDMMLDMPSKSKL